MVLPGTEPGLNWNTYVPPMLEIVHSRNSSMSVGDINAADVEGGEPLTLLSNLSIAASEHWPFGLNGGIAFAVPVSAKHFLSEETSHGSALLGRYVAFNDIEQLLCRIDFEQLHEKKCIIFVFANKAGGR